MSPIENSTSGPGENVNTSSPEGSRRGPAVATTPSMQFQWAMKSMHGPKPGHPVNVAYAAKNPTYEPMEAKAGPLEVMALPTSLHQENMENYSGEGKDQDGEGIDRGRAVSGEEKDMDGSGEGINFPGVFETTDKTLPSTGVKLSPTSENSPSPTDLVTVDEHTTLFQWQLLEQPTTLPHGSLEPDTAEEARGETLYINRHVNNLFSASTHVGNSGSIPAFSKHSKDKNRKEVITTTSKGLSEVLTTSQVTTVELLDVDMHWKGPAATEEPLISVSWVQEEKKRATSVPKLQSHLSVTPAPTRGSRTGVEHLITTPSGSEVGTTEKKSTFSEPFTAGSKWTPLRSSNSEDNKGPDTTEDKDMNKPFDIIEPNWEFDLIPSGRLCSCCF